MKTILALVFCLSHWCAMGQVTVTWKGGHPGRENDWQFAGNWSNSRLPDHFNNVYIPDVSTGSGKYPIVKGDVGNVNGLFIEAGASLTIAPKGSLVVESPDRMLVLGRLLNKGSFKVLTGPSAISDMETASTSPK